VTTSCNLACTYYDKEDLDTPGAGRKTAFDSAEQSIDLLLNESPNHKAYNIVLFGGEPLSNMPLIRDMVAHAKPRFAALGKEGRCTLTTDVTLLTESLADCLDDHCFGLTVSMDRPRTLHDLNHKTIGGKGSYDAVAAKARMLLSRHKARPARARVTVTTGVHLAPSSP
tara:strand:+ start:4614 stop:5120 length:507 start_codon:yes stop_codon:yes gene_type:complete